MASPTDALRATSRRRTENPRTILAFYATVVGLLLAASVAGGTAILATGRGLEYLPYVLGFGAICAVLIIGAVFWLSVKDPSKLMLGRITGEEYVEIQRITLGDSSTGERLATLLGSEPTMPELSDAEGIEAAEES